LEFLFKYNFIEPGEDNNHILVTVINNGVKWNWRMWREDITCGIFVERGNLNFFLN